MIGSLSRAMLFPRFACVPARNPGAGVVGLERLWIDNELGRVEAWLLPGDGVSEARPGPAAIFAHGNAELIEYWPEMLEPYRRMGVSLLLPEYRGYGRSAGRPTEEGIVADFVRFHDMLVARPEVDESRLVYHGRSLGGGAVAQLAARRPPAALVLQSTFTSVADVARRWLVPRALLVDRFETLPVVASLDAPLLVVHGSRDSLIPPDHGRRLVESAPNGRLVLYDADHNDCPPRWEPFWDEIRAFLGEAGLIDPP